MAEVMKGQLVRWGGKDYRFLGGDRYDQANWEELPAPKQSVIPTFEQSMAEEIRSRNPLTQAAIGAKGTLDKYAYGLKEALGQSLTQQEQEEKKLGAIAGRETIPGMLGGALPEAYATYPLFAGLFGGTAKMAPAARDLARVGGAGVIGAGLGALSSPEDRYAGAIRGGLTTATGAGLGQLAAGPFAPSLGSPAQALQQQGARLTPGQAAGGMVKGIEDAVRPLNPQIGQRQQEGLGDFNRILVNEKLAEAGLPARVGGSGHPMMESAQKALSAEYQRLGTPIIRSDQQFIQAVDDLSTTSKPYLTVAEQDTFSDLARVAKQMTAGQKNTAALRKFEGDLSAAGKTAGSNMQDALAQLKQHVEDLRGRFGAASPQLDKAYAEFSRMKEAAGSQAAMDTGLFSPGQLRGAVKTKSTVGQRASGKALLQQDIAEAERVFGDTIPKVGPGTAEKAFWGTTIPTAATAAGLTGNPWILGGPLAALAMNKLAYTRPGVGLMTGAYPWQQAISPEWQAALVASSGALANR